jgi:RNA polymerase sigma factor (sigma-70 family)
MPNGLINGMTDEQVAAGIQDKSLLQDHKLMEKFFQKHGKIIHSTLSYAISQCEFNQRLLYTMLDDMVQGIILKSFKKIDSFNPKKAKFITWIGKIVNNHFKDVLRSSDFRTREDLTDPGEGPDDGNDDSGPRDPIDNITAPADQSGPQDFIFHESLVSILNRTMRQVSSLKSREVLYMTYIWHLSEGEISRINETTPNCIRSQRSNGLGEMLELIREIKPEFKLADLEHLRDCLWNDRPCEFNPRDLNKISDKKAREVVGLNVTQGMCVKDISDELDIKETEVFDLLRSALFDLIGGGDTRTMRKPDKIPDKLSERELEELSNYTYELLSTGKRRKQKRSGTESVNLTEQKVLSEILAVSAGAVDPGKDTSHQKTLGYQVQEQAKKKNVTQTQLAEKFGVDIITLNQFLNDVPTPKLTGNKEFLAKVAEFLGKPAGTITAAVAPERASMRLATISLQPALGFSDNAQRGEKRSYVSEDTVEKLMQILEKKPIKK